MNPMPLGVCHDCDSVSSGRCWRHASETTLIPTLPNPVLTVPGQITIPVCPCCGLPLVCPTCKES